MVKSVSESERTSITIQCSARRSRWAPKWATFRIVSELGRLRIPAVTASLGVQLPQTVFKLSFAVSPSGSQESSRSSTTVRRTVRFFGLLATRKVGLRLSGWFRKLRGKTFHRTDADGDAAIRRKGVQRRKVVEPAKAAGQKSRETGSLGNWSLRRKDEKKRWANAFQVGVVLLTFMLPRHLGVAGAMWSAAATVTASVVIGSVLNLFGVKNKLSTEICNLWEEAASAGIQVSPQVIRSIVETVRQQKIPLRILSGTAAMVVVILFQAPSSSWGQ